MSINDDCLSAHQQISLPEGVCDDHNAKFIDPEDKNVELRSKEKSLKSIFIDLSSFSPRYDDNIMHQMIQLIELKHFKRTAQCTLLKKLREHLKLIIGR